MGQDGVLLNSYYKLFIVERDKMPKKYDRMMQSLRVSTSRKSSFSLWDPPVDIYESETELTVFMDVAGMNSNEIRITAEPKQLTVKGKRECPIAEVTCVHQLEIEYGNFESNIVLPKPIDVKKTISESKNGFLVIKMPLLKIQGTVEIKDKE